MKITVSNLGPIKQATVELGGLTVFVGPNGTGKSYLAKVLYGLQHTDTLWLSFSNQVDEVYPIIFGKPIGTVEQAVTDLQQLTPAVLIEAIPKLADFHAEQFKARLNEFFNDDSDMFENTHIGYSQFQVFDQEFLSNLIDSVNKQVQAWLNNQTNSTLLTAQANIQPETVIWALCWNLFWWMGGGVSDYFPAARSNYMLTYKEIYRARADEHVGLEAISDKLLLASKGQNTRKTGKLIRIDKPTEDFLSRIYNLNSAEQTPLAAIADTLQNRLYGGDNLIVNQPEGALPDFVYKVQGTENNLRLHLVSSMVTETSPILVGFRHWVQPNGLVIIDEPESHLHPEAQSALINVLAEAVNQGLRLILITHSPYILSCVNNLIKFGKLTERFANDEQVTQFKAEHPDMVALKKPVHAYHFGRDGEVKDIVLPSGLIDEAEFTEPFDRINELYEAMRDIEWEHRE